MLSCDFLIFDNFRWFRFISADVLVFSSIRSFFFLVMRSSGCFQWPSWDWYIRKYISPTKITPCKFNVGPENRPAPKRKGSKRKESSSIPNIFQGEFPRWKKLRGGNFHWRHHFGRVLYSSLALPTGCSNHLHALPDHVTRRQCELREFLEKRVTWTGSWPSTVGLAYTWRCFFFHVHI